MLDGWAGVLADNAAEDATGRRLIAQLSACEVAALAFCRLLERWARGEADPCTPGRRQAALRRAAERAETALVGPRAAARPVPARARAGAAPRAAPGTASRARGSCATGRTSSTARACRVSPVRVAQAYLELAVLVRALEGLARGRGPRLRARPLVALGGPVRPAREPARPRRSKTCARSPRSRAVAGAPSIAVVGSINLDLVARCERLPRPGETLTGATFERVPGGKGANQALAAARLGASVATGRRGRGRPVRGRGAGAARGGRGRPRRRPAGGGADGRRADRGRRGRREPDRRRARGERAAEAGERPARRPTRCSASSRSRSRRSPRPPARARFMCLNAAPARSFPTDCSTSRPARRQPLRAGGGRAVRRPDRADARRGGGRPARGRAARSPAPRPARSRRSTGPPPATRSPPACSSRCSRAARATRR